MKKLFVAMPYGVRKEPLNDEEPARVVEIDFDSVWENLLKEAVPSGFQTKRADELRQPGLIDRLYNEWLFEADIVLADLTFGNPNVYYELGIRQALSRKGTVLVACKGTKLPFDVRNQYVIEYDHFSLPTYRAFRTELKQAIKNAAEQALDSPVYIYLPGLVVGRYPEGEAPESKIRDLTAQIAELTRALSDQDARAAEERFLRKLTEAKEPSRVLGIFETSKSLARPSPDFLEQLAIRLREHSYFDEALDVLRRGLDRTPQDSEFLREVGFVYRKKGPEFYSQAEEYLRRALQINGTDAEGHGMLGGLLRRRGDYLQAFEHYKKAHYLEPTNLYPLVTLGGICAALGERSEAQTWYARVKDICNETIEKKRGNHWTFLNLGEALTVLGEEKKALDAYQAATEFRPPIEDLRSAAEQLEFLRSKGYGGGIVDSVVHLLLN